VSEENFKKFEEDLKAIERSSRAKTARAAKQVLYPILRRILGFDCETDGVPKKGKMPQSTDVTFATSNTTYEVKNRLPINSRLCQPGALVARSMKYGDLQTRSQTTYKAAREVHGILENLQTGLIGWAHNARFDIAVLEGLLFQNLFNPYQLKTKLEGIFCSWEWSRFLETLGPLEQASSFKLADVARALDLHIHPAMLHTASGDVALLKLIVEVLLTTHPKFLAEIEEKVSREERTQMLKNALFFLLPPPPSSFDGRPIPFSSITTHPKYGKDYLICVRLDRAEFDNDASRAIEILAKGGSNSKSLWRQIKARQQTSFVLADSPLGGEYLSGDEWRNYSERAEALKSNDKLVESLHQAVLAHQAEFKTSHFAEQRRIDIGFPCHRDKKLMEEFHRTDPEDLYQLSLKFEQPVYHEFALWIILDNYPECLPNRECRRLWTECCARLFAQGSVPWVTIPEALNSIDELMPDADPRGYEILRDYQIWLERMIRDPNFVVPRKINSPEIPF